MYWYNIKALEKDIIEDRLTDKQTFYYFLAFVILDILAAHIGSESESSIIYINALIFIMINIWGCYAIFNANAKGDGKDFFKRYWALSWVIGIRLIIWLIGILFIYYTIVLSLKIGGIDLRDYLSYLPQEFVQLIFGTLFYFVLFSLLRTSFERVSSGT